MTNSGQRRDDARILADRLAAVFMRHEPGWKLPRQSVLARRYGVRPAQLEQAVTELTARHLIRQLPDGQLYRASPADLLIEVPAVAGLGVYIDPMGGELSCRHRKVSWCRLPENIGWALGMTRAEMACVVKCQWSVNRESAAISATYLTENAARHVSDPADETAVPVTEYGPVGVASQDAAMPEHPAVIGLAAAVRLEIQPPAASVARRLELGPGQPAVMVTVRYDHPSSGCPVALTLAAVRPDLFRVVIDSTPGAGPLQPGECAEALDDHAASMTEESAIQEEAVDAADAGKPIDGTMPAPRPADRAVADGRRGVTTNG